ncbi:MAG: hypothetical protein ACOX1K_05160 [Defluviitoga tunisiensis]|jgi:hypothetical protein
MFKEDLFSTRSLISEKYFFHQIVVFFLERKVSASPNRCQYSGGIDFGSSEMTTASFSL